MVGFCSSIGRREAQSIYSAFAQRCSRPCFRRDELGWEMALWRWDHTAIEADRYPLVNENRPVCQILLRGQTR